MSCIVEETRKPSRSKKVSDQAERGNEEMSDGTSHWITSSSRCCSSTHQHFGVCMVPDLIHSIPRGAVHPGLCSIQHGDGHGGGQQVDPLQHGPLRPTQRL